MKKTCFMFGHSTAKEELKDEIIRAIRLHYLTYNVRRFLIGHYGAFDAIGKRALTEVKKEFADMEILVLTPYLPIEKDILVPEGMDGTLFPEGLETVPLRLRIPRANRAALKIADTVICHVTHIGNTQSLLREAEKSRHILRITNIV